MKDTTKKVIILDNFSSPYISQAIIVLKEYNPNLEGHIIDEAEKIVADYINENYTKVRKKERHTNAVPKNKKISNKNHPHLTLHIIIVLASLAVAGIIFRIAS